MTTVDQTLAIDMWRTCFHAFHMNKMIQIRNVPEAMHRQLKARAALEGMSMSLFILRELDKVLGRARRQGVLEAIARRPEVILDPPAADVIREGREERGP